MPANLQNTERKLKKLKKYLERDIYEVIGTECVNFFRESFHNEGFTDSRLKKWKDVKRRDPGSGWYGFKAGMKGRSSSAMRRPILSGETQELYNSIQYRVNPSSKTVTIFSDKVYARVHNEGGNIKVFGKGSGKVAKRQFMGKSQVLKRRLDRKIKSHISKIMNDVY